MSKIALSGDASGTGTFTIASPNSNNNRTLNLPDSSGTLVTTGDTIPVSQGGTGTTTLTANNVLLGNGTSAVQVVAPGASGNLLTSNGTTWTSAAPASSYVGARATIYTSGTNTFTIPAGITALKVTVIGGGGGGGGAFANACAAAWGGGGGGGGFSQRWITGQTPGSTVTATVGAGGAGGAAGASAGSAGGTSSFGAFCSATGGSGGTRGTNTVPNGIGGAGGTGSSGNINIGGFRPNQKDDAFTGAWAGGYAALYGVGGLLPSSGGNGNNGVGYGGGGSGAYSAGDGSNRTGGNGAGGVVIIEY